MNVKLHEKGCMPTRAHATDAGYDCIAAESVWLEPLCPTLVDLGFSIELWDGHEAQIRGRSGLAVKGIMAHVGTIDSAYRGPVKAVLTFMALPGTAPFVISRGERVAQMIIAKVETPLLYEAHVLGSSDRGANGFGSTGL